MTADAYRQAVLALYLNHPDTPKRAHRGDRAIADLFFRQQVPLEIVAGALRLGCLRRHYRDAEAPPLQPVRALAYFRHIVHELMQQPTDPGYLRDLATRPLEPHPLTPSGDD